MNKRSRKSLRKRKGAGTALVLTLFFILLISALVVALLISMRLDRTNTQGYYQSARVQELANGALEEILSDLKSEIDAGSRAGSVFATDDKQIYVPQSNLSAQPARIGFNVGTNGDYSIDIDPNKLPPSLVRVSRAAVDTNTVFPSTIYDHSKLPPQRASAVSTTNYSANGRTISPKRWNTSYLLSGSATPPTRFLTNAPDWIYVTRGGSRIVTDTEVPALKANASLDDTNNIVGRYAFIVYDAGGLIDINCAGFPSSLAATNNTNGLAAIRGKSSLLYAALTSLPGLTNKVTEIDNLVAWKNKGSIAAASNSFLNATTNWNKNGFLYVTNGDNPILSRKDLIAYVTNKIGNTQALPYLGTFSRNLSAPSVRPARPAGVAVSSTYDYDYNADQSSAINRDLANVRFSGSKTITHYDDDYNTETYTVKAGDPLLQSRFSLAKLKWLDLNWKDDDIPPGPTGAQAQAIKACFGLVWDYAGGAQNTTANGGNKCWNYVGSTGNLSNPPGAIKTLAEVAAEGREPNFFELLKAAILTGSLGKGPGPAAFLNATTRVSSSGKDFGYYYKHYIETNKFGTAGMYSETLGVPAVPAPARIPDMQIIRIGANIIDQYDADGYPTPIYFRFADVVGGGVDRDPARGAQSLPVFGPVTMAYGTENLPVLASIRQFVASPNRTAGTPATGTDLAVDNLGGWRQPFLWNVHQPPTKDFAAKDRPSKFEIRAFGTAQTYWEKNPMNAVKGYNTGLSPLVQYDLMDNSLNVNPVGSITFELLDSTTASKFCFHEMPFPLVNGQLPNVTADSPFPGNKGDNKLPFYDETIASITPYSPNAIRNHFVAFSTGVTSPIDSGAGTDYRPFYVEDGSSLSVAGRPDFLSNTYILGWKDSAGGFHPYSFLTGAFTWVTMKHDSADLRVGSANFDHPGAFTDLWILPDPRTERFSMGRCIDAGFGNTINVFWQNGASWPPVGRPMAAGFSGIGVPWQTYGYDWADTMINKESADPYTCFYSDVDGVVRPGDGLYSTPGTGDGVMTFISAGSSSTPVGDNTSHKHGRRPIILDRPFNSVAELGYVFRDQPYKTLDFFSDRSADLALLDLFCLNDTTTVSSNRLLPIASGRINLNAASAPVISALLRGGAKKEADGNYNISAESAAIGSGVAKKILQATTFTPFGGYRELAPALVEVMRAATTSAGDKANKAYLEAPIRALSDTTDFRTWNLMIDLIAQSGQLVPNANKLSDFTVQGEYRVWLHVAIDRYTGEVIARQIEPVYE
jgi:hypothetical protein